MARQKGRTGVGQSKKAAQWLRRPNRSSLLRGLHLVIIRTSKMKINHLCGAGRNCLDASAVRYFFELLPTGALISA